MKILFLSGARIAGGAELSSLLLAAALRRGGHEVEALCPTGEFAQRLDRQGFKVHLGPIGGSVNLGAPLIVAGWLKLIAPQLVVVTTSDLWVWTTILPKPIFRPKLVLVRHMALPLPARVLRLARARADAIVAVSQTVRTALLSGLELHSADVLMIPNAARFPIRAHMPQPAQRSDARRHLGLPSDGRWLGFLGGLSQNKGLEDVLFAAGQAVGGLPDIRVLICGREDHRRHAPDLAAMARRYGLQGKIHYLGLIEEADQAITACDLIVIATHPTLGEGAPLTAIDALSCGTPLAAYGLDALVELGGPAPAPIALVPPLDRGALAAAVSRILGDPTQAAKMAQAGLARARTEFDPARMVARYETLFRQLI